MREKGWGSAARIEKFLFIVIALFRISVPFSCHLLACYQKLIIVKSGVKKIDNTMHKSQIVLYPEAEDSHGMACRNP